MPSSAVRTFTDPDDYTAAIRGTSAELTLIGRGRFNAKLTRIDLHRLWMHRFSDNLPRIAHRPMCRAELHFVPYPARTGAAVERY